MYNVSIVVLRRFQSTSLYLARRETLVNYQLGQIEGCCCPMDCGILARRNMMRIDRLMLNAIERVKREIAAPCGIEGAGSGPRV